MTARPPDWARVGPITAVSSQFSHNPRSGGSPRVEPHTPYSPFSLQGRETEELVTKPRLPLEFAPTKPSFSRNPILGLTGRPSPLPVERCGSQFKPPTHLSCHILPPFPQSHRNPDWHSEGRKGERDTPHPAEFPTWGVSRLPAFGRETRLDQQHHAKFEMAPRQARMLPSSSGRQIHQLRLRCGCGVPPCIASPFVPEGDAAAKTCQRDHSSLHRFPHRERGGEKRLLRGHTFVAFVACGCGPGSHASDQVTECMLA